MKIKILLTLLFLAVFGELTAQDFTYKLVNMAGETFRLKGEVYVNDSLILIKSKKSTAKYKVKITLKNEFTNQYKLITTGDYKIRFTLNQYKSKWSLVIETIDTFTNNLTTITYFLKPKNDDK